MEKIGKRVFIVLIATIDYNRVPASKTKSDRILRYCDSNGNVRIDCF